MLRNLSVRIFLILGLLLVVALPVFAQFGEPTDEQLKEMGMTREEYNAAMSAYMGNSPMMPPSSILPGNYVNEADGYSINVPEGWEGMYLDGGLILAKGSMQQMMETQGGASIVVTKSNTEEDGSNNPMHDIDFQNADLNVIKKALEESTNQEGEIKGEVESVTRVKVDGKVAIKAMIIMTPVNPELAAMMRPTRNAMHFIHHNELDYNIIFSTPVGEFENHAKLFEQTLNSFKFN